jgi:ABC-type sugar transport system substrate-binding protein
VTSSSLSRRQFLVRGSGVAGVALMPGLLAGTARASGSAVSKAATAKNVKPLVLLNYNTTEYPALFSAGFEAAAKQLGVQTTIENANNDPSTQLNEFQEALTKSIGGIGMDPVTGLNVANVAHAAQSAGTYVIGSWGVPSWYTPWQAPDAYTYISPDIYAGVEGVIEVLAKALDGKGTVVRVRGSQGNASDLNIVAGQDVVLKKYPGIKVAGQLYTDWSPAVAQTATSQLLSRYPDAVAVIASDDGTSTGAVAAIEALGKKPGKDILVVGQNGSSEACLRVAAGTQLATDGSVPSLLGYLMAVQLFDRHNGWTPSAAERGLTWYPPTLTKANISSYIKRYVKAPASTHFDAKLMSQTLAGSKWDPQVNLTTLNIDDQWAGTAKPAGWSVPVQYSKGMSDGSFAKFAAQAKAANKFDLLGPSPVTD